MFRNAVAHKLQLKVSTCNSRAFLFIRIVDDACKRPDNNSCTLFNCPWRDHIVTRDPFLKSPESFRAHFGWHNSLFISSKRRSLEARSFTVILNFYSVYNIWKDQLYRMSGSEFYEWLFGPDKYSELSSNGPQVNCEYLSVMSQHVISLLDETEASWWDCALASMDWMISIILYYIKIHCERCERSCQSTICQSSFLRQ